MEEEKRAKAQKKLTGPIVVPNSGPDGYSAKLFSSLEKGLFLFSGVGTSQDVRCKGLYADGDACIHRCRQHYAAQGVAPTPLKFFVYLIIIRKFVIMEIRVDSLVFAEGKGSIVITK